MPSVGEILRQEREAGGKTIEEMAEATAIRPDFLTALEQDAFETLPGRGFGKLYIRAYADVLGFDPRPVIDAYDRAQDARPPGASYATPFTPPPVDTTTEDPELEEPEDDFEARWAKEGWAPREQVAAPEPEPPPAPARAPEPVLLPIEFTPAEETAPDFLPPTESPPRRRWLRTAAVLLVVLTAAVVVVAVRFRRAEASPPAAPVQPAPRATVPDPAPAPIPEPPPTTQTSQAGLAIREFGIGDRDRFEVGERVTFTTRVLGGRSDDRIRHVWMRDGKVEQVIGLPLGSSTWRTHSIKTVGQPGAWAVEARDAHDQVLARSSFDVVVR